MIISSTNAFILQHRVHINLKKNKVHLTLNTNLADVLPSCSKRRTRDCKRLDHNQNDPECIDERHGAPISFIWVECRIKLRDPDDPEHPDFHAERGHKC